MIHELALCLLMAQGVPGQRPQTRQMTAAETTLAERLRAPVANYSLTADNMVQALVRVAGDFKLPLGLVWVDAPRASEGVSLAFKDISVSEALASIIKHYPGYKMDAKNGVVHVFPSELFPNSQNFLKLRIGRFEVENADEWTAHEQLSYAVRTIVAPSKPSSGGNLPSAGVRSHLSQVGEPRLTLRLEGALVEDVLDAIALDSWRKVWVVTFREGGQNTATGFGRTSSLWNDAVIPDEKQPVWDTFQWGASMPPPPHIKNLTK
jgi:hypothetical protein